jgi:3-dehydroquinate dehydratase / shikimate dehydrogenase
MKTRLTVSIPVNNINTAVDCIQQTQHKADVIELRLDYLDCYDIAPIKKLIRYLKIPFIITLRSKQQGGNFEGTEADRLKLLTHYLTLRPNYIDIEFDAAKENLSTLKSQSSHTQFIVSYHNFNNTPQNLDALLQNMLHPNADIYKIITTAKNSIDSLRMMHWIRSQAKKYNLIGHCMGEHGIFSRIASPVIGNYFLYLAPRKSTAVLTDQVTLDDIDNIYHIRKKDFNSKLYALIGDPIKHSIGHEVHNNYFYYNNINALYIKISINKEQLLEFIHYSKLLPFRGISVTMPLKHDITPLIKNKSAVSAINTLKITNTEITGINTDGTGAINAIRKIQTIKNKDILIIGAGGSAEAIAYEASKQGANASITNRTPANANKIASRYAVKQVGFLEKETRSYHIIINTLPPTAYQQPDLLDWVNSMLSQCSLLMDINYNQADYPLATACGKHQAEFIDGSTMFMNQALSQLTYWGL